MLNSPWVGVELQINSVSKTFIDTKGREIKALKDVSLTIEPGEFVVLLGPSGCGKTTLLRSIAGFEKIDAGAIWLGEQRLDELPANKRPVNTVFQSYALFPHMTVAQNVAFGLQSEGMATDVTKVRVSEMLELVHLIDLADRKPGQMSGGQQQRAALARALAKKPQVLLLDEPLAALDLKLRKSMQTELKRIHRATGTTFLFVTHDQTEAMAMGDRIAVFSNGQLRQVGTPAELYDNPADEFVASFIGDSTTFIGLVRNGSLEFEELKFPMPSAGSLSLAPVQVSVRPEAFSLSATGSSSAAVCGNVRIEETIFTGSSLQITVVLNSGKQIKVLAPVEEQRNLTIGTLRELYVDQSKIRVLEARTDQTK